MRLHEQGMTIIELLVAIIVGGLMTATITAFGLNYWSNSAVLQNDEDTLVSRLNAGDFLRGAINSASGLIMQNDLADTHTLDADPSNVTGNYWIPIHAVPTTYSIGNAGTITPLIYYTRPSLDASKNIIMNGTSPYQDDVIIFMDGTTKQLKARVIANPTAPGNAAKTTCQPAVATNVCPADTVIADNVSSVAMRYFSRTGNTIDYTSITDPATGAYIGPDFTSVEVIEFTLNISKQAKLHNGATTINKTVIRVALRN